MQKKFSVVIAGGGKLPQIMAGADAVEDRSQRPHRQTDSGRSDRGQQRVLAGTEINTTAFGRKGKNMNILLCCNAGMSSSILVKKIKAAAEKRGMDINIQAVANAAIREEVGKWDVCLVGPQLVYAVPNIKAQLNIPVASVEPRTYAMADGDKALDFALNLVKG